MRRGLIIAGPTGVGKTELAYRVARLLGGHLISCDSVQVYRGLNIGANKSNHRDNEEVLEFGIDLIDPHESFTAADYHEYAQRQIKAILAEGRVPILVGGTGFYLDWLLRGRPGAPATDPTILVRLEGELSPLAWSEKLAKLTAVDPSYAASLSPNDDYRLLRALAVWEHTGRPLNSYPRTPSLEMDWRCLYLTGDRDHLSRNIDLRCEKMVKAGLIQEVQSLQLDPESPAGRAIGYQETLAFLSQIQPEKTMAELDSLLVEYLEGFQAATRQYSRRQETWFRRLGEFIWLERTFPPSQMEDDRLLKRIVELYEMPRKDYEDPSIQLENQRVRQAISGDPKRNRQVRKSYRSQLTLFADPADRLAFLQTILP